MAASQYNLYYDSANSSWNEYVHVSLLSSNYLYLGSIANGGSFGSENHLLKIAKSDLTLSASKKWDTALVNINVQGLCTDGTYLYWAMCYNNVIQYSAIVKTDLSLAHVKSIYWNNTGICPQQIQLMKAYDGTSYLVSIQNNASNRSALRTIIADHTNWTSSVTTTTNRLFTDTYIGSIRQIDPTSSGSALICAGVQVVGGINRAVLVKVNQINGSPYGRLDTTIAYQSGLERQGFSETDTFAVSFLDTYVDPDDTNYIWAVGNSPKNISTPLVGRNTILARFKLSDMTLQNLVEISSTKTSGTNYGFAGASILIESDKIYISTWHLPHSGLGDNTEVTTDCTYVVTCLDKSNILAASGSYVNFSLAYEEGGSQGQAGNLGSALWSDGTYIYACPWTSVGTRAGWSAAVIKIDRTRGTGEPQYLDATAAIKEYDFSSYLSFNIYDATAISQIVAATHDTWHNHILTNQAWDSTADEAISNRTDGIDTWTPTVKGITSIDSTSLVEYLRPNGAGDSIRSVYGQAATWVPSGTSTANLYTLVDEVTLDSTDVIISRTDATWTGEMFTLSDPSTSVQRILKAEIGAVARYSGSTTLPYLRYLWRTTGTTALHNAGSWVESTAISVGTGFAEVASIDVTTVSTALKPNWTRDDIVNLQVGAVARGISGLFSVRLAQQWVKLTWEPFNYQAPTLFADIKFSDANSYSWSQTYDVAPVSISATASVTVPTLAQTYILAPANVSASRTITVPTLAQVYVSAPANVSVTAAITVPTLTQVISAVPANISRSAAVSVPILTQLHIAAPANVSASRTITVPTLIHNYAFTPASLTATRSITVPTLTQLHNIAPANYQARAEISVLNVSLMYILSGASVTAISAINAPAITQIYRLAPANISSTSVVSAVSVLSAGAIAAVSISATAAVTVPTLTQVHAIAPANISITAILASVAASTQGQMTPISIVAYESITEPVLTQLHMAAPANVTATETITPPVLTQVYTITCANVSALAVLSDALLTESASAVISPVNIILYPSISVPALSQAHAVSVSNVSATKTITAVNVSETGADILTIAAVTGTATLSAATLSQIYSIQAANVSAGGQASVAVLSQNHIIAAANISASASVDTLNIIYGQFLTIDNVVATAGVTSATLVIDAWEQTIVIDGITRQAALSIASVLQTHAIAPSDIICNTVIGTAGIGTFGKIYKPQIKSLSYKRLTIESK